MLHYTSTIGLIVKKKIKIYITMRHLSIKGLGADYETPPSKDCLSWAWSRRQDERNRL